MDLNPNQFGAKNTAKEVGNEYHQAKVNFAGPGITADAAKLPEGKADTLAEKAKENTTDAFAHNAAEGFGKVSDQLKENQTKPLSSAVNINDGRQVQNVPDSFKPGVAKEVDKINRQVDNRQNTIQREPVKTPDRLQTNAKRPIDTVKSMVEEGTKIVQTNARKAADVIQSGLTKEVVDNAKNKLAEGANIAQRATENLFDTLKAGVAKGLDHIKSQTTVNKKDFKQRAEFKPENRSQIKDTANNMGPDNRNAMAVKDRLQADKEGTSISYKGTSS